MKPVWSDDADRDIDSIWEYIAADNIDAADELIETLRKAADQLSEFPMMGRTGVRSERANSSSPGQPISSFIGSPENLSKSFVHCMALKNGRRPRIRGIA